MDSYEKWLQGFNEGLNAGVSDFLMALLKNAEVDEKEFLANPYKVIFCTYEEVKERINANGN